MKSDLSLMWKFGVNKNAAHEQDYTCPDRKISKVEVARTEVQEVYYIAEPYSVG
jgi:hypothetical protein